MRDSIDICRPSNFWAIERILRFKKGEKGRTRGLVTAWEKLEKEKREKEEEKRKKLEEEFGGIIKFDFGRKAFLF